VSFTPGPGNYTLRDDIGKGGNYISSKYHNANGPKFGFKLDDNTMKYRSFIPGPGTYESPSDFGRLDILDLKSSRRSKVKLVKTS
jgi:hypothetical protein